MDRVKDHKRRSRCNDPVQCCGIVKIWHLTSLCPIGSRIDCPDLFRVRSCRLQTWLPDCIHLVLSAKDNHRSSVRRAIREEARRLASCHIGNHLGKVQSFSNTAVTSKQRQFTPWDHAWDHPLNGLDLDLAHFPEHAAICAQLHLGPLVLVKRGTRHHRDHERCRLSAKLIFDHFSLIFHCFFS